MYNHNLLASVCCARAADLTIFRQALGRLESTRNCERLCLTKKLSNFKTITAFIRDRCALLSETTNQ